MPKDNNAASTKQVDLISENAEITGNIITSNDMRIDGTVNGNIRTSGRLVVGTGARIIGNVDCGNVDCLGYIEGDVKSDGLVALKARAVLKGTIIANSLSIESGAVFNGSCKMERGE